LKGGHSGLEIILQRGNANKLLVRTLRPYLQSGTLLAAIDGGGLRNAIPREARATVLVPVGEYDAFVKAVAQTEAMLTSEYKDIEDSLSITVSAAEYPETVMPAEAVMRLANLIGAFPNGVVKMHTSIPRLVQTSNNFARVISDGKTVKMQSLMRSSVRSEKEYVAQQIASVCDATGAKVEFEGGYDGWNLDVNAPIVKMMSEQYQKLYGEQAHIVAVHAGLECGIIGGVYPSMEMISFGPTIRFPHSPDEKVHIPSVEKFWKFLVHSLENAPVK
jgi:dipeptidase D